MATKFYTFEVLVSNTPTAGLLGSMSVIGFKKLSNNAALSPNPTLIEYGNGLYGFGVDPEVIGDDSIVQLDLGAGQTGVTRYLTFRCLLSDSRTTNALGPTGVNLPANQPVEVGSYAAGLSPAEQVLGGLGHEPIATNAATGAVEIDVAQVLSLTPTAGTVGEALLAARAQAFGAWTISGTTLTLFAPDGVTPVRVFTLNSASNPSARS